MLSRAFSWNQYWAGGVGSASDETGLVCLDQGVANVEALGEESQGVIAPFSLL